jgi:oligopeptidase B
MLVTAGLHDPRVAYWEATKWVATLRSLKTDANPLLLKVDMDSGSRSHFVFKHTQCKIAV